MNATGSGEPLTHQQAKVWLTKSSFPFLLGDLRGLRVRPFPLFARQPVTPRYPAGTKAAKVMRTN